MRLVRPEMNRATGESSRLGAQPHRNWRLRDATFQGPSTCLRQNGQKERRGSVFTRSPTISLTWMSSGRGVETPRPDSQAYTGSEEPALSCDER
jgi:hypothetical protein